MWSSIARPGFGFMNTLDGLLACAPLDCLEDLHASPTLIVTSDYSGHQKGSVFEIYALLVTGSQSWDAWESARLELRRAFKIGRRRISFKGLNDARKRHVLPCFLNAADHLSGVCVALAVQRNIQSLFRKEGALDLNSPELSQYAHYNPSVFERLLRVVHFVSFFLAGLSRPGQDVLWFTDQDAIAANDRGVVKLTEIWANVFGHYLQHDLRHIKCGTTRCDNGTLQIEDLASVPDLAAGALGELLNRYATAGGTPGSRLVAPAPAGLSRKSTEICTWLAYGGARLNRLVFLIEQKPDGSSLRVKDLRLHAVDMMHGLTTV
jgi:hypothetical protein